MLWCLGAVTMNSKFSLHPPQGSMSCRQEHLPASAEEDLLRACSGPRVRAVVWL